LRLNDKIISSMSGDINNKKGFKINIPLYTYIYLYFTFNFIFLHLYIM